MRSSRHIKMRINTIHNRRGKYQRKKNPEISKILELLENELKATIT